MAKNERFVYGPDDPVQVVSEADLAEFGIKPIPSQEGQADRRTRVRAALGEASYAMSDEDIDRVADAAVSKG
jgi:hypothetical protein